MGCERSWCISSNVINPSLSRPRLYIRRFVVRATCRWSGISLMKRAMSFHRRRSQPWGQPATVGLAPGSQSRPFYPLLDVNRILYATNGMYTSSQRGSRLSLKDALATSRPQPTASFGIGLGRGLGGEQFIDVVQEAEPAKIPVTREGGDFTEEQDLAQAAVTGGEESNGDRLKPPWSASVFTISSEMFNAARAAATGSPESYWSHTMYEKFNDDGTTDKIKVHYCISKNSMEHVCSSYFSDEPILGFDLEWMTYASRRSGPRENVSLIQIASPSRIALFHVALFPRGEDDFVGPTFRKIMGDPDVSKVGVNILADFTRLRTHLGVESRGIFELSQLYRVVKFLPMKRYDLINKRLVSLAAQVEDQLGLPLFKGDSVRGSNWMKPLDKSQIQYSAADAYAGIQLYHVLEEKRKALDPCPQRPFHAELGLPIPLPDLAPPKDENVDARGAQDEGAGDGQEEDGEDFLVGEVTVEEFDTLTMAPDMVVVASNTPPKMKMTKSATSRTKTSKSTTPISADPRIVAAELRMEQYRSSKDAPIVAKPATLRAYYLWAEDEAITPETIAGILRDPPLQTSTVVTYIMDAIMAENLSFSKDRVRRDLLPFIRKSVLKSSRKYYLFFRACQDPND